MGENQNIIECRNKKDVLTFKHICRIPVFICCLLIFYLFVPSSLQAECISGDCYNGTGTYTWPDGQRYVGEYRDDNLIEIKATAGGPSQPATTTEPQNSKYIIWIVLEVACAVFIFFILYLHHQWKNKSSKQEGFHTTEDSTGSIPNPTGASIPSDGSTTARVTMSKATRDKANYFVDSWRGDKSLAVSYWINGFLLTFALQVLIGLYNSASTLFSDTARLHVRMYFFVAIILEILVIAVSVWQTVGIWRSAEHHKEQTNRKFIATLAQIIICITVLVSYGKIVGLKDYYNDVFWNALGKDPLGGYHLKISDDERELIKGNQTYRIYPNKKQLTISGVISFGVAKDVDDILSANPQIKTVILNSDGGRIWEGENLFDVLTDRGIEETVTETGCSSACTIAFLAGKIRSMRNNKPLLGFHSSSSLYYLKNSVDSENRRIHTFMVSRGISSAFANKALSVSPSSMWYPSFDILWNEGIVDNEPIFADGKRIILDVIDPFAETDTSQWNSRKR